MNLKYSFYFLLIILGYLIHKPGIVNNFYQSITHYIEYKGNRESANKITPESIKIFLSDKNINKLYAQRRLAIEVGENYKEDYRFTGYVKGKMVFGDDTLKIKLRQKGLFSDHFEDSLKSSYKIKISKGKTFLGMERFAIQHPKTRGYLDEWYLHRLFKYSGLISLRYDFIEVYLNDRYSGVYAIEENVHKNLIENNELREGPVFRYNIQGEGPIFYHEIKSYNSKRLKKDSIMFLQYKYAEQMLIEFRGGLKKTSDIFDIEKLAKYYAIIDLTGHHHASHVFNLKFYFNPVSGLIEPIGYDNSSFMPLEKEGILGSLKNVEAPLKNRGEILWQNDPFSEQLFNDIIFFKKYINYLIEFSNPYWLDEFFLLNDSVAQDKIRIIWRTYPEYQFNGKSILYHNQKVIKNYLSNCFAPIIKDNIVIKREGWNSILLRNQNILPLEIVSISINNKDLNFKQNLLQPHYENEEYVYLNFKLERSSQDSILIMINYRYPGIKKIETSYYRCKVVSASDQNIIIEKKPIINRYSSIDEFELIKISEDKIQFQKGEHNINKDLILPPGRIVVFEPGVVINLVKGAKIISQSPFFAIGTESDSVLFISKDRTGQGLFILNSLETSSFEYCKFKNLSNLTDEDSNWGLSGSVNIYQTNVLFNNCSFSTNLRGDDMLNIMNSKFELVNCNFFNVLSDGFDGDFVTGKVIGCYFNNIGNDAMDFSGSNIEIINCEIKNVDDKALSVGENSRVKINGLKIEKCEIAITAKDNSYVKGKNISIFSSSVGLCAFQKKSQFGSARIELDSFVLKGCYIDDLIEKGSVLVTDDSITNGNQINVEDMLYGKLYGKRTIK